MEQIARKVYIQLLFLLCCVLVHNTVQSSSLPTVILVHSLGSNDYMLNIVVTSLQSEMIITLFDVSEEGSMPTVQQLLQYNATILSFGFNSIYDPNTLGKVMNEYVSSGGPLIITMDNFANDTYWKLTLGSAFPDSYYAIYPYPNYMSSGEQTLVALDSSHPILSGVSSFDGGSCSDRGGQWSPNGHQVAQWSDGTPLIGTLDLGITRRVDMAFFIVPTPSYYCGWNTATDGFTIISNAVYWVIQKEELCSNYQSCVSCTSQAGSCEWCLDTGSCTPIDFSCPDRIYSPEDCPAIDCTEFFQCTTCLDTNNDNECVWCLDNHSCVGTNTTCFGEITHIQYCNSDIN